jgi:hypothetical protein
MVFDVVLMMGAGTFLGNEYLNVDLETLSQTFLYYSLGLDLTIGLASLRVFGAEVIVFWRENAPGSGMNLDPMPYFLGKNLIEIPRLAILTLLYAICFYPLACTKPHPACPRRAQPKHAREKGGARARPYRPRTLLSPRLTLALHPPSSLLTAAPLCPFWNFYFKSICMAWHTAGWAQFMSVTLRDKPAQLCLVVLCLVHVVYGDNTQPSDEDFLAYISPNRWLVDDLYTCHTYEMSDVFRYPAAFYLNDTSVVDKLSYFRYTEVFQIKSYPAVRVIMNLYMGLMVRVAAYVALTQLNREKKGLESVEAVLLAKYIYPFFTFVSEKWPAWATIDMEESFFDRLSTLFIKPIGVVSEAWDGAMNPVHADELRNAELDTEADAVVTRLEMLYSQGLMSVETYIAALEQIKNFNRTTESHNLDDDHNLDNLGDDVQTVEHEAGPAEDA